ncbi:MAG: DUF3046 domain-containing protein [Actinomycetota bacterium]|nr:DUF3046 domain-containing protein [Actinomycetota bacterium]
MRLTDFWQRMHEHFGPQAEPYASDQVLGELGGRTVTQALADGDDAREVWRAVCRAAVVPKRLH